METNSKKMGLASVLIEEEDVIVITWVLGLQECGLSITLQQLKTKVTELIQIRPIPFKHGVPGKTWWYWFNQKHP
jgi:hypothetical protein